MKTKQTRVLFVVGVLALFSTSMRGQNNFWHRTNGFNGGYQYSVCIDSVGRTYVGGATGAWVSTDNGDTWTIIASTGTFGTAYALLSKGPFIFLGSGDVGVFRSSNHGESWIQVNTGLSNRHIVSFAVDSSGEMLVATTGGLFRSTNNGDVWFSLNLTGYIAGIAISPNNEIFAAVYNIGVFRSTNNGSTWTGVSNGIPTNLLWCIARKSNGSLFVGTDGQGIFRSTDNGDHWIPVNTGLINLQVQSLMVSINGDLYAGTNSGVHISTNGDTWFSMGTQTGVISDIGINSLGHIFVASWSGVFRTTGSVWKLVGVPVFPINTVSVNPWGDVFAAGYGVFRSSNYGEDWIQIQSDQTNSVVAFNQSGHIFAGGRALFSAGIMRSTNGTSWSGCLGLAQSTTITSIVIHPLGKIFAGATGGDNGIYRSEGNCNPWTQINTGLTNTSVRALAFADDSTILAGTVSGGFRSTNYGNLWNGMQFEGTVGASINAFSSSTNSNLFAGTSAGVFRSTDLGLNWARAGLMNVTVSALVSNSRGHLFAASYNGVYRSIDQGTTWSQLNSGLVNLRVNGLAIDSVGHVIAATDGGIFRSNQTTTSVHDRNDYSSSVSSLEQNYPNPFNPTTIIKFQILNTNHVTLKVFNLLGREVATLVNEEMGPGKYERVFNAQGLASGVYLYQLRAGGFVQTKKLLLLR